MEMNDQSIDANGRETMSAQEQDAKTQAQIDAIREEIKIHQKLTSELLPISDLSEAFKENENGTNGFLQGCEYLSEHYKYYRSVRGDGNCYYRAFLFGLVESLYQVESEFQRIMDFVKGSIDEVVTKGYDRFTIETFHEELVDLLTDLADETRGSSMPSSLFNKLNEENGTSDYCVWYLRVITSVYLQSDPERFVHFLEDPSYVDVPTYCAREIDPMGKESSMVGVLALAEAFGVRVDIEYLDGKPLSMDTKRLVRHSFGGQIAPSKKHPPLCITLLYRPGHYDILYKS